MELSEERKMLSMDGKSDPRELYFPKNPPHEVLGKNEKLLYSMGASAALQALGVRMMDLYQEGVVTKEANRRILKEFTEIMIQNAAEAPKETLDKMKKLEEDLQ